MSQKSQIYRAVMIAATIEALGRSPWGLDAPERPLDINRKFTFQFALDGDIPAVGSISDWYKDECSVRVALWPTEDGERCVKASGANQYAGDVWAGGYLYRTNGIRLECSGPNAIFMTTARKPRLLLLPEPPVPGGFLARCY